MKTNICSSRLASLSNRPAPSMRLGRRRMAGTLRGRRPGRYSAGMVQHDSAFLDAFKGNPLPFLLIFLLAAAGLALGVAALVLAITKGSRAIAVIALGAGLLSISVGLGAWALGRTRVEAALALPGLNENDRRRLRAAGEEEAWAAGRTGLFGSAPAIGLGVLSLLLGGKKKTS